MPHARSTRRCWRTEGVELEFTHEGIERLAEIAFSVNERTENIGARRLYTVMEKLLEEVVVRRRLRKDDRRSSIDAPTSTRASTVWRATRTSRVTSSSPRHARAAGVLLRGAALG